METLNCWMEGQISPTQNNPAIVTNHDIWKWTPNWQRREAGQQSLESWTHERLHLAVTLVSPQPPPPLQQDSSKTVQNSPPWTQSRWIYPSSNRWPENCDEYLYKLSMETSKLQDRVSDWGKSVVNTMWQGALNKHNVLKCAQPNINWWGEVSSNRRWQYRLQ